MIFKKQEDPHVYVEYTFNRSEKLFTVRMEYSKEGAFLNALSACPEVRVPFQLLEEKVALLRVSPVGADVEHVGWRRAANVFYVRIYESDLNLGEMK